MGSFISILLLPLIRPLALLASAGIPSQHVPVSHADRASRQTEPFKLHDRGFTKWMLSTEEIMSLLPLLLLSSSHSRITAASTREAQPIHPHRSR